MSAEHTARSGPERGGGMTACACFTYWDEFLGCNVWANSTRGGTCEHPASGTPEEAA